MPYCTKCGERVSESDVFCSRCGARLGREPGDLERMERAAVKTPETEDTATEKVREHTMARLKLSRILGIVALVVAAVALVALLVNLEVKPGHYHLADSNMVNTLKVVIWFFGLVGGGLLGYTSAVRLRSRPGAGKTPTRSTILLVVGVLLLLWSIERMMMGVTPEYYRGDTFYGLSAVVAAVLMVLSAAFGAFFLSRGLIRIPRGIKR